ncbi:LANO_0H20868g1_1 [Lachancea nothofagi CBS 11611]|uniref:LANO_0H20868g1_1 n=1 Tax=Lachancea nothofagi CBS 11611 TaxID=1266666 RepID=A0A1G4KNB0_9SACH|nr:LANO_0H20868g1_1 [Lachancea nothofagi CBS 11611]
MLVIKGLPLEIPPDVELPPGLSLARQAAAHAIENSPTSSPLQKFDILLHFVNELLKSGSESTDSLLEENVCIVVINMAYYYQQVTERLIKKAYTEDSKEAWGNSGLYNKKSIGLLRYLIDSGIANTTKYLGLVETFTKCWTLSQQLSIVMLSLSKLKSRICGNNTGQESKKSSSNRYDRLLEFQESDLKDLATSSLLYARLCIGCRDSCTELTSTSVGAACHPLTQYLDTLTFILLSLDRYKNDECGASIGMLEAATECLSHGLITSKQLKLIQESTKLKTKMALKLIELKSESSNLRSKFKIFKKNDFAGKPELHPLLRSTLEDFIMPLMMLLHYRYVKTNDKVFFQPIIRDREELVKGWPHGKTPDVTGTSWAFDGEQLRELDTLGGSEYY